MKLILKYVIFVLAIYLAAVIFDAPYVKGFYSILLMGLVLLIVNLTAKPVLLMIVMPFNIVTFGLFSIFVNTLTIIIADGFVRGVRMGGILPSLVAAVVITALEWILIGAKRKPSGCGN